MAKIAIKFEWLSVGKSGGSRVITYVKIIEESIFLLSIYDKGNKESISDKELDNLLRLAGLL